MKILKKLLPAVALLAIASSAQADVTVHIAGSTAYRSACINAVANLMTHTSGGVTTYGQAAYIGGNLAGANYVTYVGTVTGIPGTTTVELFWSGSVSGQSTLVTNPQNITWINPDQVPASGADAIPGGQSVLITHYGLSKGAGGGKQLATSGNPTGGQIAPEAIADFAFSDAFQSSAAFKGNANELAGVSKTGALHPATGNGDGIGEEVGIIPFVWVIGAANTTDGAAYTTWQAITNITTLQAKFMLGNNSAPASFLTGNSADDSVSLLITGRDGDSGTRITELSDASFGVFNTTDQYTFAITGDGVSGDNAGASISDDNDFTYAEQPNVVPGNNVGGYNTGGSIAKAMAAKNENAFLGGYIISYLGVADADSLWFPNGFANGTAGNPALPANYVAGHDLTFNGVQESLAAINLGKYSCWTYEHFFARPSTETVPGGEQTYTSVPALLTVAGKIVNQLETVDSNVAGYQLNQVTALKSVEGGVITPGS